MHYADWFKEETHAYTSPHRILCTYMLMCSPYHCEQSEHSGEWLYTGEALHYTTDMGNLLCVSDVITLNNRGTFLKITSCIKSDVLLDGRQDSDCCYSNLSWARVHIFSFGSVCCSCYQILCPPVSQSRNPTPNPTFSSITQLAL